VSSRSLVAFRERLETNPSEAKRLDEHGKTVLYKSLSRRMDDYPSDAIIRLIVEKHRAAVWEGLADLNGNDRMARRQADYANSPLVVAAWKRASLEILQCLTEARPSVPSQDMAAIVSLWNSYRNFYGSEQELVNLLVDGGREGFAVFVKLHHLLRYCTGPGESLVSWTNGRSLTIACSAPHCPIDLFHFILDKFPAQIKQPDDNGRVPLHTVVAMPRIPEMGAALMEELSRYERMKVLLRVYPQGAMVFDHKGQLPLHLAIQSGWHHLHLMELLAAAPPSISALDETFSLYPFQLAATHDSSLTTIFKLLLAAPNLLGSRIPPCNQLSSSSVEKSWLGDPGHVESKPVVPFGKSRTAAVSEELQALLQYVKDDPQLWMDLQTLLGSPKCVDDDWLVVHAAVSLKECPIGLIRVLLRMHPEQLRAPSGGRTPLHCAAANAAKSLLATTVEVDADNAPDLRTLRLLAVLEAHPAAARITDSAGQLPLHLAAYHGQPAACLESLIEAWPGALCQPDARYKLYPFLWAACSPMASLTDVFMLLQRAPHVIASGL
jgi:ankyrin repeat protein